MPYWMPYEDYERFSADKGIVAGKLKKWANND